MTNMDRFNEAFAHMEHEVMGRRLAKFSLRHRFWLEAMRSPVVTGGGLSLTDLELAVRVCEIPAENLDRVLPRLLERGPGRLARWLWPVRTWGREVEREYRDLQGYFTDHGCPPALWDEPQVVVGDGEVEHGSLPGVLGLVTGLMRGTGWPPETVWQLSPGEAEWYLAGVFLHRGVDVGIKTAADEAMEAYLRKREQREKREKPSGEFTE